MFTKKFWRGAFERSVKTAAQFTIYAWGLAETVVGEAVGMPNAFNFDWQSGLGSALAGFVLSILTSVASAPWGDEGTASLVNQ